MATTREAEAGNTKLPSKLTVRRPFADVRAALEKSSAVNFSRIEEPLIRPAIIRKLISASAIRQSVPDGGLVPYPAYWHRERHSANSRLTSRSN
ncbi:hypothetical protein KCP76_16320 [Salmonella enterica subsp. enterica serovar Weltevreden]|nr:hypothetical protein KCP76_16320 [Salmonella enterica subsp. enterica serovar Weltevreden]